MFCAECGTENKTTAQFCEQCGGALSSKVLSPSAQKPLGIVIISMLSVLGGTGEIIGGWIVAFVPQFIGIVAAVTGQGISASDHIASLKIAGLAIMLFVSGILTFASAYGLWNFIGWGRVLSVALNALGVFVGVILFFTTLDSSQSAGAVALQIFGFALGIWILIYLFRPNIKDLFHGPHADATTFAPELRTQI